MGSVEWEDESWWKREWGSPKEVYKLHTEGKSIAGIARELNFSWYPGYRDWET